MKILILLLVFLFGSSLWAHDAHYTEIHLRQWIIPAANASIEGTFLMVKNGEVYIETTTHLIVHYPLAALKHEDRHYVQSRYSHIEALNNHHALPVISPDTLHFPILIVALGLSFAGLLAFAWYIYVYDVKKNRYVLPVVACGAMFSLYGFTTKITRQMQIVATNPLTIDSAFVPFRPNVHTRWDNTYFYVESKGIPDHEMMRGITGWQQQFPIPQCYIGANAWSIPLNPEIAATPVPVNPQHFLRGAVAIAVNGVAIFNPYTNTGVDAFLDGQLDIFGGHCGRADDYHYHTAPLQLYSKTAETLPIAYALDGFAVYGAKEPDGGAMTTLDANHGHYAPSGVYHYHGTTSAPYMIGNMVGKVTEDNTMQIIPQASAKSIRPAGTPLKGAVITGCVPNGTNNGYTLTYTLSGQTYSVEYNWDAFGKYTFKYINPSGTTSQTYNGFTQCTVPPSAVIESPMDNALDVYPNPAKGILRLKTVDENQTRMVRSVSMYSLQGEMVYHADNFVSAIPVSVIAKGNYILRIEFSTYSMTKKILVQ